MADTRIKTEAASELNKLVTELYQQCIDLAARIPLIQKDVESYKQIAKVVGSVEVTNLFVTDENNKEKNILKMTAPTYLFFDDINIELEDNIKIHSLKIANLNLPQTVLIVFHTNEKKRYFLVNSETSHPIKCLLIDINKAITFSDSGTSNSVEIKLNKFCKTEFAYSQHSSFWARSWDNKDKPTGEHYDSINDPMVLGVFKDKIMKEGLHKSLEIFDVGGGKARLAKKLIDFIFAHRPSLKVIYVFVEPEKNQFDTAKEVLQPLREKYPQLTIDFHEGTLDSLKEKNNFDQYQGKVDVIISSGGPLNDQVVSYNMAKQTLTDFNNLLSAGGKIIATGISTVLFSKKDFIRNRLNVLSCLFKNEKEGFLQCYVLEKPTAVKRKQTFQEEHCKSPSLQQLG